MEEVKEYLGVHPRMPNWETAHMGTFQSLVSEPPTRWPLMEPPFLSRM